MLPDFVPCKNLRLFVLSCDDNALKYSKGILKFFKCESTHSLLSVLFGKLIHLKSDGSLGNLTPQQSGFNFNV